MQRRNEVKDAGFKRSLLRTEIIKTIWNYYQNTSLEMLKISEAFERHHIHSRPLDHFALIDLPSPLSGIKTLKEIFTHLGYVVRGEGYLPEKQNGFLWLAEEGCEELPACQVLPQVVVADFCLDELPVHVRNIIEKYTQHIKPAPLLLIHDLIKQALNHDEAKKKCTQVILSYLAGRDWPLPTRYDYELVKEFNELLSWVLVFGRRPNHFTLSIHLLNHFSNLNEFHTFIQTHAQLSLNQEGDQIKGNRQAGIEQGSTNGALETVLLADGAIQIPTSFVEFVWRYPHTKSQDEATLWGDYFTGFVSDHANKVIESLCVE